MRVYSWNAYNATEKPRRLHNRKHDMESFRCGGGGHSSRNNGMFFFHIPIGIAFGRRPSLELSGSTRVRSFWTMRRFSVTATGRLLPKQGLLNPIYSCCWNPAMRANPKLSNMRSSTGEESTAEAVANGVTGK